MATNSRRVVFLIFVTISQLVLYVSSKATLINLDEDNWHQMLYGEWMVEFFAPWCPACKALQPVWTDFASWSEDLGISVGQVDVTSSPGLSGRFMVTALPTIYHVKDGVFRQYRGSREKEEFMSFIEEKRWEQLEEIPAWKSPASFQLSIVAQFFKLSMLLRGFHSVLVEDYGLPTWGSYLVFALATILVGALLGLLLVCIIDFVFPVKPVPNDQVMAGASMKADKEEDLVEDIESEKKETQENPDQEEKEENDNDEDMPEKSEAAKEEAENSQPEDEDPAMGSPELRKRRPRKAD